MTHTNSNVNGSQGQLRAALAKCARLERQIEFIQDYVGLPNNKVSAVDKIATLAALWDIDGRDVRPDGKTPIYYPNIADRCGVSERSLFRSFNFLEKSGVIDRDTQKDKQGKSHTAIAFNSQFLADPRWIIEQIEEESNHGGDRRTLCECGCGEFVKRTIVRGTKQVIVTCKACGTVQSDETIILDKVTNTDEVAFDASKRDELAELDERVDSLDFSEIVDIPDEEFIPTYDEPLTLFPVEKKPVQGSVPFADMPEGARVALQAVSHRECFSCHDAGRETRWKPVQRDDNSWIAACEYCSTHKGK